MIKLAINKNLTWLVCYDPCFYSLYYLKTERGPKVIPGRPQAEFDGPTGANPGLAAMTTHMLRLQLTQD